MYDQPESDIVTAVSCTPTYVAETPPQTLFDRQLGKQILEDDKPGERR
jgi:hypothetical protein